MKYNKIMFAGPSGYGKTTLAQWLSEIVGITFESGSVSDLLPNTKDMFHKDMLSRDSKELYTEDFQILNLRNKLFKDKESYISDRSYLDSAAYFLYKQADKQPSCELDNFFGLCGMLLAQQCDCLIFLNFVPSLLNEWVTQDNSKRITSNYFQVEISSLMKLSLDLMGYKRHNVQDNIREPTKHLWEKFIAPAEQLYYGVEFGSIHNLYGKVDVIIINEPNLKIRKNLLIEHIK